MYFFNIFIPRIVTLRKFHTKNGVVTRWSDKIFGWSASRHCDEARNCDIYKSFHSSVLLSGLVLSTVNSEVSPMRFAQSGFCSS